jgi:hypothetical protein
MRSMTNLRRVSPIIIVIAGCAGPSRSEMEKQDREASLLMKAHAVHMPKDVDSCVGVTLRLTDPSAGAEAVAERASFAKVISKEEIAGVMQAGNVDRCKAIYLDAVAEGRASPEPMHIAMHYGIDPAGRVCAVVEKQRMEPIDPAANPLLEASATCLKETLFSAKFPEGRVKEKERAILTYDLVADPTDASKPSAAASGPS